MAGLELLVLLLQQVHGVFKKVDVLPHAGHLFLVLVDALVLATVAALSAQLDDEILKLCLQPVVSHLPLYLLRLRDGEESLDVADRGVQGAKDVV